MREYKFRGMDLQGRWFYGNLAILTKKVDHLEAGSYISNSVGMPFAYPVRPETVGQYIGLCDRNGKEVYEGDRLRIKDSLHERIQDGEVVSYIDQQNLDSGWRIVNLSRDDDWVLHMSNTDWVEVIGNIYTSPELMEGKK